MDFILAPADPECQRGLPDGPGCLPSLRGLCLAAQRYLFRHLAVLERLCVQHWQCKACHGSTSPLLSTVTSRQRPRTFRELVAESSLPACWVTDDKDYGRSTFWTGWPRWGWATWRRCRLTRGSGQHGRRPSRPAPGQSGSKLPCAARVMPFHNHPHLRCHAASWARW